MDHHPDLTSNPKKRHRLPSNDTPPPPTSAPFSIVQAANLPGWRQLKPSQSPTPPRSYSPPLHGSHQLPPPSHTSSPVLPNASSTSAFRNVSACNRCRSRKNRCDQQLPACSACEKAGVKCVGFDPITKKQIPRSYIHHLESRANYLESILRKHGIEFVSEETFALDEKFEYRPEHDPSATPRQELHRQASAGSQASGFAPPPPPPAESAAVKKEQTRQDEERLNNLVSSVGMVSVQGASDPRYLGSTSGISFARVVFAALQTTTVSRRSSEFGGRRSSKAAVEDLTAGSTSMRDSFFGLHTRPAIKQAPFPDADLGLKLVDLYFEYTNPQIPTLHRGEFMQLFRKVYTPGHRRTPRECYLFNMVFAIGSGIIFGSSDCNDKDEESHKHGGPAKARRESSTAKRPRLSGQQHQPEEYHAAAIVHLESFLASAPATDQEIWVGGGLEELQAVLLLASFALLRPVAPGLWYIVGVAVRLGIDLGLHHEEDPEPSPTAETEGEQDPVKGRRQWILDLRRRLFWCVYSFDRLVSISVGRPFGITDQVITAPFPSLLDDEYITPEGIKQPPKTAVTSYKTISHHYFHLRLLQSEILQVLQYQTAQKTHHKAGHPNPFLDSSLPSPFLQKFPSFREWRLDADRRLWEWWQNAPPSQDTGVEFNNLLFELNYWQAVLMLFRTSLTAPAPLAGEAHGVEKNVESPPRVPEENPEDQQFVFLKIAEAGQRVLKIYRQLHLVHLVNYTFLATHHLFMAGISFLYAMWHSNAVRSHLSLDDVDFTVLAATSVLTDLMEKCPPAEACRDAFTRMAKATIKICMSTTGFGPQANQSPPQGYVPQLVEPAGGQAAKTVSPTQSTNQRTARRPPPKFDANLKDLFTEDEFNSRPFGRLAPMPQQKSSAGRVETPTPSPSAMPASGPEIPNNLPQLSTPSESVSPSVHSLQSANVFVQRPGDYYSPSNMDSAAAAAAMQAQQQQQNQMDGGNMNDVGFMLNNQQSMGGGFGGQFGNMDMDLDVMNMAQEFNPSATVEYMAQDFIGGGNVGGYDLFDGFFFGNGQT